MKKVFSLLFLLVLLGFNVLSANAMKYEAALSQSKPMAILIYAPWADNYASIMQSFKALEASYGDKYNFVTINIATEEAKTFNKSYHIYPNIPYVLLFKERGRITRFLQQSCVMDNSCITNKLDVFVN